MDIILTRGDRAVIAAAAFRAWLAADRGDEIAARQHLAFARSFLAARLGDTKADRLLADSRVRPRNAR